VAEVEDVAESRARALEDVVHSAQQPVLGGEEQGGIEVPLDRDAVTRAGPALVERSPPVHSDHGASRLALRVQQVAGAGAEVDEGHAGVGQRVEDAADVGQHQLAVVGLVEGAHPGVEDLQGLGPGLDLGPQVVGHHLGEQRGQAVPGPGSPYMRRLVLTKFEEWPPSIA
jgi:hypothetical protein